MVSRVIATGTPQYFCAYFNGRIWLNVSEMSELYLCPDENPTRKKGAP
jgi:hypothetical protein